MLFQLRTTATEHLHKRRFRRFSSVPSPDKCTRQCWGWVKAKANVMKWPHINPGRKNETQMTLYNNKRVINLTVSCVWYWPVLFKYLQCNRLCYERVNNSMMIIKNIHCRVKLHLCYIMSFHIYLIGNAFSLELYFHCIVSLRWRTLHTWTTQKNHCHFVFSKFQTFCG